MLCFKDEDDGDMKKISRLREKIFEGPYEDRRIRIYWVRVGLF
jgi:hypothetical protein